MSGKQWLCLLILFVGYLLLGAAVFWHIERQLEVERLDVEMEEEVVVYDLLVNNCNSSNGTLTNILDKLEAYCGKDITSSPDDSGSIKWNYYNSVFFVLTVVSTIGYGNLAPTCMLSRMLMIVYALIGIPLNGILLTHMANYFAHFFLLAHERYKMHRIENKMGLIGNILMYLIPGFLVFIICPAFIFSVVEGWEFDVSVYYAFVSLTTIGFGDYVAGQGDEVSLTYSLYKAFLIMWVVFGLGYLVMLLGFITQALRSKRMARLEHKLSKNIKHTQNKLWNGFVAEMGYFRRVLNELYLMKLKPVYHDDSASLATVEVTRRSASCPDLRCLSLGARKVSRGLGVGVGVGIGVPFRPRAYSEAFPGQQEWMGQGLKLEPLPLPLPMPLARRRSETELSKIDRRATFADAAAPVDSGLDPAELLQEFMNALVGWRGAEQDPPDTVYKHSPGTAVPGGGYQGFPEADILSSERQQPAGLTRRGSRLPRVSTPGPMLPGVNSRARARAMSLAPFSTAAGALAEQQAPSRTTQPEPQDQDGHESDESTLPADDLPVGDSTNTQAEWTWSGAAASRRVHELIRGRQNRRRSEAPIYTTRSERKLQDLQQFQHQQYLEQMRQAARDRRQQHRRPQVRSKSTSAADPDANPNPDTGAGAGAGPPGLGRRLREPVGWTRRDSLQPPPALLLPNSTVTSTDSFVPGHRYRTQSAGERRASAFSIRRDSCSVHPMLENTSLADFLRVLQSVHTQHSSGVGAGAGAGPAQGAPCTPGKTRKLGTAGLQPPPPNSIFNLFPTLNKEEKELEKEKPRRMSFWPAVFSAESIAPPARKLSAMFSGGGLSDTTALHPKPVKKRRFSIWPAFGFRGNEDHSDAEENKRQPNNDSVVESGLNDRAPTSTVNKPQITISYVSDSPPSPTSLSFSPPPREALRRIALANTNGNLPRPSLSNLPVIVAAAAVPVPGPVRRGPSLPAPVPQSPAVLRRRAFSDAARETPQQIESDSSDDESTYDVRL